MGKYIKIITLACTALLLTPAKAEQQSIQSLSIQLYHLLQFEKTLEAWIRNYKEQKPGVRVSRTVARVSLRRDMTQLLASVYTREELEYQIQYHSSELGQSIFQKQHIIAREYAPIIQDAIQVGKDHMDKLDE